MCKEEPHLKAIQKFKFIVEIKFIVGLDRDENKKCVLLLENLK